MLVKFRKCFFLLLQNAWQNECPEEFVEYIYLDIPPCVDVENPLENAAFMTQIGAKKICDFPNWFELKNAVTGTMFTFKWVKNIVDSGASNSICSLRKEEMIVEISN